MVCDAFGQLQREAEARPVVMGVALHPYLIGQLHRASHLRRALEHVRSLPDGLVSPPGQPGL